MGEVVLATENVDQRMAADHEAKKGRAPVRGAVSSVAADKTGIGYATKKLAIDVMDWDIIKRLVGCADDGGAASRARGTINLTSDAQLEDVTGALGSLWNVGVKASLLGGSESTEVGFEDPERADSADGRRHPLRRGGEAESGFTVRVQPPPPEDRDSDDTSWYNWAEIPRFRHSFSKQLRLRAVRYGAEVAGATRRA
ncbi:hypothetical protein JL720_12227 [Aureococcus anophagefferens]|nr:hypothetical protein JL720_12227 [Aureococcus anophagefferens]